MTVEDQLFRLSILQDAPSILNVEVELNHSGQIPVPKMKKIIEKFLRLNYKTLMTQSFIPITEWPKGLEQEIKSLHICEASPEQETIVFELEKIHLRVFCFLMKEDNPTETVTQEDEDNDKSHQMVLFRDYAMPFKPFEGIWENLNMPVELKQRLLGYVSVSVLFHESKVDQQIISCNKVILLHGSPGSGKTSLCHGLAQKIAIRYSEKYSSNRLIEINAHSLFSKWFSESGKLVTRLFKKIRDLLSNPLCFCCILIDEVESLANTRKMAAAGTEPTDSLRAVNALLTQIDLLKHYPNCLVMATSNLSSSIDLAFVDRADLKLYIGPPSQKAIYGILKNCIGELSRVGIIKQPLDFMDFASIELFRKLNQEIDMNKSGISERQKISLLLFKISMLCQGSSGRYVRKLPFLAFSQYLFYKEEPVEGDFFLEALFQCVKEEQKNLELLNQNHI